MRPEFSERQYEHCFEHEFENDFHSMLHGVPYLPSSKWEAVYPFDIRYGFKIGDSYRSLVLQYKVSSYISKPGGRCHNIYTIHGGPYYYFYLDSSNGYCQQNLLYGFRLLREDGYYAVPLFCRILELFQHSEGNSVVENSRFIDPLDVGHLDDPNPSMYANPHHKIACDSNGLRWSLHSDKKNEQMAYNFQTLVKTLKEKRIDEEYFSALLGKLRRVLAEYAQIRPDLPLRLSRAPPFYQCIYLLGTYYSMSWLVF